MTQVTSVESLKLGPSNHHNRRSHHLSDYLVCGNHCGQTLRAAGPSADGALAESGPLATEVVRSFDLVGRAEETGAFLHAVAAVLGGDYVAPIHANPTSAQYKALARAVHANLSADRAVTPLVPGALNDASLYWSFCENRTAPSYPALPWA